MDLGKFGPEIEMYSNFHEIWPIKLTANQT